MRDEEGGLRPAVGNETRAGRLSRTYPELDDRVLGAIGAELEDPARVIRDRQDDAWELAAEAARS